MVGGKLMMSLVMGGLLSPLGNYGWASDSNGQSSNIGNLIRVPSGQFQRDGNPQNVSTVSSFLMSEHEITRSQYVRVTGLSDPSTSFSRSSGDNVPVQNIRWYDTIYFSNKLSLLEGLTPVYSISGETNPEKWGRTPSSQDAKWDSVVVNWNANGYRLPTEMEWRWAAMGADRSPTKNPDSRHALEFSGAELGLSKDSFVWCSFNSQGMPHEVGSKRPNALGLYDMTGNVWEWNWDWQGSLPYGALVNYRGTNSGDARILHGGSWRNNEDRCNNIFRLGHEPYFVYSNIGFRVVRGAN